MPACLPFAPEGIEFSPKESIVTSFPSIPDSSNSTYLPYVKYCGAAMWYAAPQKIGGVRQEN